MGFNSHKAEDITLSSTMIKHVIEIQVLTSCPRMLYFACYIMQTDYMHLVNSHDFNANYGLYTYPYHILAHSHWAEGH